MNKKKSINNKSNKEHQYIQIMCNAGHLKINQLLEQHPRTQNPKGSYKQII